jgi:hypothetical protein
MIIEMAGRPEKHLTESLEKHVGVLREVKDAEVHEIKVSEPRALARGEGSADSGERDKEGEEMFTAFAECDFEIPSFARLSETMFDFMPSSVEVIEPSSVEMDATEATDLLNNISGRLHRYDEIAKIAGERLRQMDAQLKAMQAALIERDKTIGKLKKSEVEGQGSGAGSDEGEKK